jgi:hypothetical protein
MIQIDELTIRIPDFSEAEARQLGRDVADHLAQHFAHHTVSNPRTPIDQVNIQLPSIPAGRRGEAARLIANQIIQKIGTHEK